MAFQIKQKIIGKLDKTNEEKKNNEKEQILDVSGNWSENR